MPRMRNRYIALYKPYGMVSQFTRIPGTTHATLAELGLPADIRPVGRLDHDSEGLLLLSDDKRLVHRLLEPNNAHPRTYLVQVEGIPTEASLQMLRRGVVIKGKRTRPARVRPTVSPPMLLPRSVPVRYRRNIPTSWIELEITEGRNRQVRRMTAAVGYPTLRLVRRRIGSLDLFDLTLVPGLWRPLTSAELYRLMQPH